MKKLKLYSSKYRVKFPGSPIFIMRVSSQNRHLEVQLLCDQHGNITALHSSDCSVQQMHRKIIEEDPIIIAPVETVKHLVTSARKLWMRDQMKRSLHTTDSQAAGCDPSSRCIDKKTKLVACLRIPGTDTQALACHSEQKKRIS
ncbi:Acetyl-CoA carboxylase 1 [Dendrobium catenatum]|uniref:Acetyl-CoA carboxylase 1 n=1 Tax=Dendrobium catenatum TaxID=906689 RepID=A0A2I0W0H1_9ASPA|nr:Acetyl-CoA carboxylase 1 [Dendrobium catenatum]